MTNNLKELYLKYTSNKNNEPISDPVALEEIISIYTKDIEMAIKDRNKRISNDKRNFINNRINHLRKQLKGYQDAYNWVVAELTK